MVASRWTMRWRNGLMVAEIAVSTILLVGAALMVKSLVSLTSVELGFRTDNVLALSVGLPVSRYKTQDDRLAFFEKLEVEIRRLPGVQQVGYANRFPLRGAWSSGFAIDGFNDGKFVTANFQAVSPGYFDTLGLRLVRGRLLTPADIKTSEPVAVVSEAFSKRLLNGAEPLGVRFRRAPTFPWITVVGVIADLRRDGQKAAIEPEVYLAAGQTQLYPTRLADIAILTSGDPRPLANSLRDAVWAVDKDQPVANVRTLEESVSMAARESRFQATLVGLFALLALTLAVVGIHGVVSYAVSQRTPEIGVRMALGADRLTILRWLLSGTALLVGVGSVIGIAGAAWLSTYVRSLLFQVQPTDIGTYALSALLLSTVALGAAALAARKATLIDPVTALRSE
jgi:putative ABC transport system permease protein